MVRSTTSTRDSSEGQRTGTAVEDSWQQPGLDRGPNDGPHAVRGQGKAAGPWGVKLGQSTICFSVIIGVCWGARNRGSSCTGCSWETKQLRIAEVL
jgi:hypothetical protein